MEKNDKIACFLIISLLIFNFFLGFIAFHKNNDQGNKIERIILFSLDSCNPEYLSPDYMPKIYSILRENGIIYKNAWAPLAAETMNGHTTMLTGCWPNSTGILGNGYYDSDLGKEVENPVQDPEHRLVNTIFEDLKENYPKIAKKTGFISGKWRLPDFLAYGAEYVFASHVCEEFDICPEGYENIVGYPITHTDGDIYDQWCMRALTELVKRDDPKFIFVNLAWLDVSGHDTGAFNSNHRRELHQLDDLLWQFMIDLKAMGKFESTLFIITGDHGMASIFDVFNVEGYLEDNGIKLEHVHGEGGSAFIFLKDKDDINKTVDLLEKNDKIALVLPRDEMYKLHLDTYENRTGQIYISCKENIAISFGELPMSSIGTHGHVATRDVPMAFMGPTIKKGEFIQESIPGLEDIFPTIYYTLGLDIPNYIDGRILYEIFE
ncbi:MAG: alkaline phosphatase family protein [Promethearchaeota archaeon]